MITLCLAISQVHPTESWIDTAFLQKWRGRVTHVYRTDKADCNLLLQNRWGDWHEFTKMTRTRRFCTLDQWGNCNRLSTEPTRDRHINSTEPANWSPNPLNRTDKGTTSTFLKNRQEDKDEEIATCFLRTRREGRWIHPTEPTLS